jgi:hypothetical protein
MQLTMDSADVVRRFGEVIQLGPLVHGASVARCAVEVEAHIATPAVRGRLSKIELGISRRTLP